jgi:hypothetical protein
MEPFTIVDIPSVAPQNSYRAVYDALENAFAAKKAVAGLTHRQYASAATFYHVSSYKLRSRKNKEDGTYTVWLEDKPQPNVKAKP